MILLIANMYSTHLKKKNETIFINVVFLFGLPRYQVGLVINESKGCGRISCLYGG